MKYRRGGLIQLLDIEVGDPVSYLTDNRKKRTGTVVKLGTKMVKVRLTSGYESWQYPGTLVAEFYVMGSPTGPVKVPYEDAN
jgi:hypothetical protein